MPFLSCGGYTESLETALIWMSSGDTKSVVHKDTPDNMNCLLSGRKRMAFFHPKWAAKIETNEMGWIDIDALMEARPHANFKT